MFAWEAILGGPRNPGKFANFNFVGFALRWQTKYESENQFFVSRQRRSSLHGVTVLPQTKTLFNSRGAWCAAKIVLQRHHQNVAWVASAVPYLCIAVLQASLFASRTMSLGIVQ